MVDLPDLLLPEGPYVDMFDSESNHPGDFSDKSSDDGLVEVP